MGTHLQEIVKKIIVDTETKTGKKIKREVKGSLQPKLLIN